jgi:hypothetical protein
VVLEYMPTPQGVHENAPVTVLYVPAAHAIHATPSAEAVYVTLQVQFIIDGLATLELVPTGQV